jgi:hypothetical protein
MKFSMHFTVVFSLYSRYICVVGLVFLYLLYVLYVSRYLELLRSRQFGVSKECAILDVLSHDDSEL